MVHEKDLKIPNTGQKRLVVIGGGFGGLEISNALKKADLQVVVIDKHNYLTFQPLLYQVATGGLEPGSIAYPLRRALRSIPNAIFRMAEVIQISPEDNSIETNNGWLSYDYLVLAVGSKTNFFSFKPEESSQMMQLKSVTNALDMRSFILQNYEKALLTSDELEKESLMNVAVVGGGPTGVELAGALGEMKNHILPKDYPELDFRKMQVHLFEASSRLLGAMSPISSDRSLKYIKGFGVNVWLDTFVTGYKDGVLSLNNGKSISAQTMIWTAGVMGARIDGLGTQCHGPANRVLVDEMNKVTGYENIFAIGDIACMVSENFPKGHAMVAPAAMQQGKLLGENIIKMMNGKPLKPFEYFDKGSMATVGRNKAVVDFPGNKGHLGGFIAWLAWMFVHAITLVGFRNKLIVMVGWLYNYFNYDQTLRLIIRPFKKGKV
ncbi:MAG: NAD(P)/FAD-dependent oxidoreductase [Bacteroidetes bacterium]|jgi:NADH dehydrogenase|nr:NAD(P)/FAD-dependent oxidoreductase [Bacteroidota bacterium]